MNRLIVMSLVYALSWAALGGCNTPDKVDPTPTPDATPTPTPDPSPTPTPDPLFPNVNDTLRAACFGNTDAEIDALITTVEVGKDVGNSKGQVLLDTTEACNDTQPTQEDADECVVCMAAIVNQVFAE